MADRRSFLQRLAGASALRAAVYEEVEADASATWQAVAVVLLASVAAGIGLGGLGVRGAAGIPVQTVLSLAAWIAWAFVTWQIGTRLLPERRTRADVGELLRTLGFAASPGLLNVFGLLPGLTTPVFALTSVWMILAMVVAVRQALDYTSLGRVVAVCLSSWLLTVGLIALAGILLEVRVS